MHSSPLLDQGEGRVRSRPLLEEKENAVSKYQKRKIVNTLRKLATARELVHQALVELGGMAPDRVITAFASFEVTLLPLLKRRRRRVPANRKRA